MHQNNFFLEIVTQIIYKVQYTCFIRPELSSCAHLSFLHAYSFRFNLINKALRHPTLSQRGEHCACPVLVSFSDPFDSLRYNHLFRGLQFLNFHS